ncbi:MAG: endolytic transglycosylase MltG [Muribaculaceae bacterium]|nr:endolytic transglycosylase MltG [Muribaculaceae bacterium]
MTSNRKKSSGRKKSRKSPRTAVIIAACAGGLLIIALALWMALLSGKAPSSAEIKIPACATHDMLRDSIARYLGKGYADKVTRLVKMRGTDLSARHGAYLIEAGMSPIDAMRRLTGGPQNPLTITINGFRMLPVLEQKVAARFDFPPESLDSVLADEELMRRFNLTPERALALFLNDSYDFYWSASPREVVEKIGAHYNEIWTPQRKAKAKALGVEPSDIMIVASIVDEETNALEEKGTVGRLYLNRLHKGMRLEADPTVRYAGGDFTVKRVRNPRDIQSPYNTYIHAGLPPGPIRTTSVETIDAILDSTPHDYIFMCAKEDFSGRHNFASTYAEHQVNARRYKRELDRRGIY